MMIMIFWNERMFGFRYKRGYLVLCTVERVPHFRVTTEDLLFCICQTATSTRDCQDRTRSIETACCTTRTVIRLHRRGCSFESNVEEKDDEKDEEKDEPKDELKKEKKKKKRRNRCVIDRANVEKFKILRSKPCVYCNTDVKSFTISSQSAPSSFKNLTGRVTSMSLRHPDVITVST